MRITFLLPAYAPRPVGGYRVVYEHASRLAARGHDVAVVHPLRIRFRHYPAPRNPVQWMRIQGGYLRKRFFPPRLRWHEVHPRARILVVPDASERHIPDADFIFGTYWATVEELLPYGPAKGRKGYFIQSYETWAGPAERVDATWRAPLAKVVVARWLYEKAQQFGTPAADIAHVPPGLDHQVFRVMRPPEQRPPRVAMLGSSLSVKGLADGVRALELARGAMPALEAVVFGVEARPRELPAWIEYHREPSRDVLVSEIYNGSAAYLCASHMEGWHLPPAEAMACGCALVSTDIGGVRDYAEHGVTALLSPPRQPELLARSLSTILGDAGLRLRLAEAGRQRVGAFRWERSVDRLEQFLVARLNGTAPPGAAPDADAT